MTDSRAWTLELTSLSSKLWRFELCGSLERYRCGAGPLQWQSFFNKGAVRAVSEWRQHRSDTAPLCQIAETNATYSVDEISLVGLSKSQ